MIDSFFKFIAVSGIKREDVLTMNGEDYVRVNKQLKLSQKKHQLDLSIMSRVNEAFKDDLEVLKCIYNEDLIYYTFTKDYKLAEKSEFFYFDDETLMHISNFIEKYLMLDMIDEFRQYVFKNDYRQLNNWMRIVNIFPKELKPKIIDSLKDKLDYAIEIYAREVSDRKIKSRLKFLIDPDFINCLNLGKRDDLEDRIRELCEIIISKHKGKYNLFAKNVLNALKRVHYLSYNLKYDISRLIDSEVNDSLTGQAAKWGLKFGVFASVLIIVYLIYSAPSNYTDLNGTKEQPYRKRTVINERNYLDKLFSGMNEIYSNNCELALKSNNVKVLRSNPSQFLPIYEYPHGLVTNRPATMGLDGEIANQMTGKDISFINHTMHPVLIIIVSKYKLSTVDYKFFYDADSGFSVGRYFVDSGDTLIFDHRVDYFKIQTGLDLRKFLYETSIDGNIYKGTAYGFCTVSKQDLQLLKMDFNVAGKSKAIDGSFILKQQDGVYNFIWRGKDNCISIPNANGFLKSNQTVSIQELINRK